MPEKTTVSLLDKKAGELNVKPSLAMVLRGGDASTFRLWWHSHYHRALRIAIVFMIPIAAARYAFELWRLLFAQGRDGPIDLTSFHQVVHAWFAHRPVYPTFVAAVYPPATYASLWPFLGWLSLPFARWLWGATTVAAILWLSHLVVRESLVRTRVERAFVRLFLVSMYATAITVGNGQLGLYILPPLLAACLLLGRGEPGWRRDLVASSLFVMSLAKPSISAPFVWIVIFVSRSIRPFVLVVLLYVGLNVWSASFQEDGLVTLFHDWLTRASSLAGRGGYANLHIWLSQLGMNELLLPSSLVVFLLLGIWTHRNRGRDLWLLLPVSAIVARFWTYHRMYDDLLILFPIVALFRIVQSRTHAGRADLFAGLLLALAWSFMLAPGTLARVPWGWPFRFGQTFLWAVMLVFLGQQAARFAEGFPRGPGRLSG